MAGSARKRSAVVRVPDVLGADARVEQERQIVANMLAGIQQERIRLDVLQRANEHAEDDIVPPNPGEPLITYKERLKQLSKNEDRIVKAFPEVIEALSQEGAA